MTMLRRIFCWAYDAACVRMPLCKRHESSSMGARPYSLSAKFCLGGERERNGKKLLEIEILAQIEIDLTKEI